MPDAITGDSATWTVTWPWPQVVFTDYYTLVFAKVGTDLYLFELYCGTDNVWVASSMQSLGAASGITYVDVGHAGMFYLVSVVREATSPNSVTVDTYARNPGTGAPLITQLPTSKIPECMTSCYFKGRMIIGGIVQNDANFGDLSLGWVAWSGIGNVDFRVGEDKTAGYAKVWWDDWGNGRVYKVLPLGDAVVVYGNNGMAALTNKYVEPMATMSPKRLPGAGIASRYHVDGGDHIHCYIDRDNYLWTIKDNLLAEKLGYKEFMSALVTDTANGPTKVSYVPQYNQFFISNGSRCFVLNESGLYETYQLVTSAGSYNGNICGFFSDTEDYEWRITTDVLDLELRGIKTFGTMELGINHTNTNTTLRDVLVAADYRYSYQTAPATFSTTGWVRLSPEGAAYIGISAPEVRLKIKGLDFRNGTINLDYLKARVKLSDKRFVRGIYNAGKAKQ